MTERREPRIAVIGGDGIGPEVVEGAARVLSHLVPSVHLESHEAGWGGVRDRRRVAAGRNARGGAAAATAFSSVRSPPRHTPSTAIRARSCDCGESWTFTRTLRPLVSAPVPTSRDGIDILLVRENTEGLYSGRERLEDGGETAVAERVITRRATERIVELAFGEAGKRATRYVRTGRVTVVHKANVLRISDGLFRETALAVAARHPNIEVEEQLVDSMAYRLFLEPERYDVVVAPNLFGDILSDAGAALVGGLGLVPGANVSRERVLAEPVHGSAPDIAGRGIANPVATLRAAGLLLSKLALDAEGRALERAVDEVLVSGPATPDLGGRASTNDVVEAVIEALGSPDAPDKREPSATLETTGGR